MLKLHSIGFLSTSELSVYTWPVSRVHTSSVWLGHSTENDIFTSFRLRKTRKTFFAHVDVKKNSPPDRCRQYKLNISVWTATLDLTFLFIAAIKALCSEEKYCTTCYGRLWLFFCWCSVIITLNSDLLFSPWITKIHSLHFILRTLRTVHAVVGRIENFLVYFATWMSLIKTDGDHFCRFWETYCQKWWLKTVGRVNKIMLLNNKLWSP